MKILSHWKKLVLSILLPALLINCDSGSFSVNNLYQFPDTKDVRIQVNINFKIKTAEGPVLDFSNTPFVLNAFALDADGAQVAIAYEGGEPVDDLSVVLTGPSLSFPALLRIPVGVQPRDDGYAFRFELKDSPVLTLTADPANPLSALKGAIQTGTDPESNLVELSVVASIASQLVRESIDDSGSSNALVVYEEIKQLLDENVVTAEAAADKSITPTSVDYAKAIKAALMYTIATNLTTQNGVLQKLESLTSSWSEQDKESAASALAKGFTKVLLDFVVKVNEYLGDSNTATAKVFPSTFINRTTLPSPATYSTAVYSPKSLTFTDSDQSSALGGNLVITTPNVESGIDSYNVYFGGGVIDSAKISLIGNVVKGPNPLTLTIVPGTAIPTNATKFWVFPVSGEKDLSIGKSLEIVNVTSSGISISATASSGFVSKIKVEWTATGEASSYSLYWSTSSGVTTASNKIANVQSPYWHEGRSVGTSYFYKISAVVNGVESELSAEATAATQAFMAFTNGAAAVGLLGQSSFSASVSTSCLGATYETEGMTVSSDGKLFISDLSWGEHNIYVFNQAPTSGFNLFETTNNKGFFLGDYANCGQFSAQGTAQGKFDEPRGMAVGAGKFVVAEVDNNRVSVFNSVPSSSSDQQAYVLGQPNISTTSSGCTATKYSDPTDVYITPAGKFLVADSWNNRVLIYNSIPANSTVVPDFILGQSNATTCTHPAATQASLRTPKAIWSDDTRIVVVDEDNNRVMVWNTFPTASGQAADLVLGQSSFTSSTNGTTAATLNNPSGLNVRGNQIFVADTNNNRIMIWNSWPTSSGASADAILGKSSFTDTTSPSSGTFSSSNMGSPQDIEFYGEHLYVLTVYRTLIFKNGN